MSEQNPTSLGNSCPVNASDSTPPSTRKRRKKTQVPQVAHNITTGVYAPTKRGYAGRQRARWVLAAANDRVLYSKGDVQHYECRASTFRAWMKRTAAQKDPERPAELQLEAQ